MTFEQLLTETPSNPLDENSEALVWFRGAAPKSVNDDPDLKRYGVLSTTEETRTAKMHNTSTVVQQSLKLDLFEKPTTTISGATTTITTPNEHVLYALYEYILTRDHAVIAAGRNRQFLLFETAKAQTPPQLDQETRGLKASLNFWLKFHRV